MSELESTTTSLSNMAAERQILYSIAISLKRIADIMQGKQQPVIMTAEEYAKFQEGVYSHNKK